MRVEGYSRYGRNEIDVEREVVWLSLTRKLLRKVINAVR